MNSPVLLTFHSQQSSLIIINKLKTFDYKAVRDTPARYLNNFHGLKFAFFISGDLYEHDTFRPIPPIHCYENAWKLHIWPAWLSQIGTKKRKTNWPWPNVTSSKCGQDTSARQILGHSSNAFWRKYRKTAIRSLSLSQNGPTSGISTDRGQNLISSEGVQVASSFLIWGHSPPVFPRRCPEIANWACFTFSFQGGQDT